MAKSVYALCYFVLFFAVASVGRSDSLDSIIFPTSDESGAQRRQPPRTQPKYGYNNDGGHFNVQPTSDGGFSASASQSNSFAGSQSHGGNNNNFGASHGASQSSSVNFQVGQGGFSASHSSSASQSASFNNNFGNQGSSLSASHASSQSSSFSGGVGGGSSAGAASSQAASGGGGGGAFSLASGAASSQSSGRPGYNPNVLSPDHNRTQRPRPQTKVNRNDRRRRPVGPFYNSWFNPYWPMRARSPRRQ